MLSGCERYEIPFWHDISSENKPNPSTSGTDKNSQSSQQKTSVFFIAGHIASSCSALSCYTELHRVIRTLFLSLHFASKGVDPRFQVVSPTEFSRKIEFLDREWGASESSPSFDMEPEAKSLVISAFVNHTHLDALHDQAARCQRFRRYPRLVRFNEWRWISALCKAYAGRVVRVLLWLATIPSEWLLRNIQRIMLWLAEAFHKSLLQTPSLLKEDWVMYTCWSVHVSALSYIEYSIFLHLTKTHHCFCFLLHLVTISDWIPKRFGCFDKA